MKRLLAVLGIVLCCTGCQALSSVLPVITQIISAVTEAGVILDSIDSAATTYFQLNPNKEVEGKYQSLMAKTRLALSVALRATKGVDKLGQSEVDAAFKSFREAYTELLALLGPLGVVKPERDKLMVSAGSGEPLIVPEPMALTLKVE